MHKVSLIEKFMMAQYRDCARGENGYYDCWGLTRAIRHECYGKALEPSFGNVSECNVKAITKAYKTGRGDPCAPQAGALVAVMSGKACRHVAVVVDWFDGLDVISIDSGGLHRYSVAEYIKINTEVAFHA